MKQVLAFTYGVTCYAIFFATFLRLGSGLVHHLPHQPFRPVRFTAGVLEFAQQAVSRPAFWHAATA